MTTEMYMGAVVALDGGGVKVDRLIASFPADDFMRASAKAWDRSRVLSAPRIVIVLLVTADAVAVVECRRPQGAPDVTDDQERECVRLLETVVATAREAWGLATPPPLGVPLTHLRERAGDGSLAGIKARFEAEARAAWEAAVSAAGIPSPELREPTAHTAEWRRHDTGAALVPPSDVSPDHRAMGFPQAWENNQGGGIVVGVVDTGVELSHPALAGKGVTLIDCTGLTYPTPDGNGHGTFVTSQIVGVHDWRVQLGGAPDVTVVHARGLHAQAGYGADSWIARAVRCCHAAGCKVVCMSLSGEGELPLTHAAMRNARADGVVFCIAAGNGGPSLSTPGYPARYPECIAVGSCSGSDAPSHFSQSGPGVDVHARGEYQIGAGPNGSYQRWSGTSMAAPHVAAAVALCMAAGDPAEPDFDDAAGWEMLAAHTATGRLYTPDDPTAYTGTVHAGRMVESVTPDGTDEPTPAPATTPPDGDMGGYGPLLRGIRNGLRDLRDAVDIELAGLDAIFTPGAADAPTAPIPTTPTHADLCDKHKYDYLSREDEPSAE